MKILILGSADSIWVKEYIEFVKRLVPEKYWEKVFFDNADRIYRLGLKNKA